MLEESFEIVSTCPNTSADLWHWAKSYLPGRTNMYGNLYTGAINAAKSVNDPYAEELEREYFAWKQKVGIR